MLRVRDFQAMKDFYTGVLGFKLYNEGCYNADGLVHDGDPTICFLTIKELDTPMGRHTHPQVLALIDYQRHLGGRHPEHNKKPSSLHHLAFEIPPESYDAHRDRLQTLNLKYDEVEFPVFSAKSLFFWDPEDNTLELICTVVID